MKLLFVANVDWYVISHRIKIIEEAVKAGWDVTVACEDTGEKDVILNTGAKFINFPFSRSGTNPFSELYLLYKFLRLYRNREADVIHHVSLKPVIYGSFIAKILKKPAVLNAVSGLGYVFTGKNQGSSIVQKAMLRIMKFSFDRENLSFIFQNADDHSELQKLKVVYENNIINFTRGSGVDLSLYNNNSKTSSKKRITILFPARMLWDKGLEELRTATELLKEKYYEKVSFILAGRADKDNKAGVPPSYLEDWSEGDYVNWIGHSDDMVATFREADIVVLPSYYREGIPKSLIEATAMGKPIVTTDAVGCRECVDDGINGFLVPPKSGEKIAEALIKLIDDAELRDKMGKASRIKAEKEFDVQVVVNKHIQIYQDLLNLANKSQKVATTT